MGKGIVKLGDSKWATKDGNLLAYKETNNRFTNTEFTFARGTDATYVDGAGLIVNETGDDTPRIDFLDNTDGHLLLEPASTNLITYSEDFSQGYYVKANSLTVTSNNSISPDGTINASLINSPDTSNNNFSRDFTVSTSTDYTSSIFIKKDDDESRFPEFGLRFYTTGTADEQYTQINTKTGATTVRLESGTNSHKVEDYGDYWKLSLTTNSDIHTAGVWIFNPAKSDTIGTDNQQIGSAIIWGGQFEALSYATSYIPTAGTTVTRDAETCNSAGTAQDFNDTEGVLYAELFAIDEPTNKFIAISDGTDDNRITIYYHSANNDLSTQVKVGGSEQMGLATSGISREQFNKIAVSYKVNEFKMYVNGSQIGATDTSGSVPSGLNTITFDRGDGSDDFYGKCKAIKVYKEALSDAELIALTT